MTEMGPGWSDEGTLLRCLDAALKHGDMRAAAALIQRLAFVAPDTAALLVDVLDLSAVSGG